MDTVSEADYLTRNDKEKWTQFKKFYLALLWCIVCPQQYI